MTEFTTTKFSQLSENPHSERRPSRVSLGVGRWTVQKFPSSSSLQQIEILWETFRRYLREDTRLQKTKQKQKKLGGVRSLCL
jgi:hypothetical protein